MAGSNAQWAFLFLVRPLATPKGVVGQLIREDGLIEKKGLVGLLHYYSQTGRSFAGNFANFHRNTGILIDNLLGAICNH